LGFYIVVLCCLFSFVFVFIFLDFLFCFVVFDVLVVVFCV